MQQHSLKVDIAGYLGRLILLALMYYVTGRLGLLLAVPPGYATAMWPPSGFALAGILLLGYRYWPGVLLGSFAVNLFTSFDSTNASSMLVSGSIAALIAGGAALQSVVSAWLCRRWIAFPNALEKARDTGLLLALGGPAGCLVNATVGVSALTVSGLIPPENAAFNWLTWWVGDTIGVLVFTPIVLLICNRAYQVTGRRKSVVAAALISTFVVAITAFIVARDSEQDRQRLLFDKQAALIVSQLDEHIRNYRDAIEATTLLYDASDNITREEFRIFARGMLERHPGMRALTWTLKVADGDRPEFEASQRRDGFTGYVIKELDAAQLDVPAAHRELYYPATYIEPFVPRLHGFDNNSDEIRRATLEAARDGGNPQASSRLILIQRNEDSYGMLIFRPVYQRGAARGTLQERRSSIKGFIVGAFILPDLIDASLRNMQGKGVDLFITDDESPPERRLLYDSRTADHKEGASPASRPQVLRWEQQIDVAGRTWTIHCIQNLDEGLVHQNWAVWLVLAGGLLFTGLFGVSVMVITARTDIVRRLVEERTDQLLASESRHQQLVDGVQDYAIYWLDPEGKVESWNTGAERITGYASQKVIGQHFSRFYPEEDQKIGRPQMALDAALAQGVHETEGWRVRKDGGQFWASESIAPLRDHQGQLIGFAKVTRDITERRNFEETIKASEGTFRAAMEHASIGMALVEPGGRWLKVNNALCELIGYSESELMKTDFQTITHPEDLGADLEHVKQMLAGEIQTYQMEKRYLHKDGRVIWILLSVSLVQNADGTPKYFVSQIQDITSRKQVDRMKDEFIATVSHELRTPLTSIRGSLGLVNGGVAGVLPEKAARLVDVAYRNTDRLTQLINDILDMERINTGKLSLDLAVQSLSALVEQAVEANRGYAQSHDVSFALQWPLPHVGVNVDANRILQVLANLLSNAAKFSPAGGVVDIGLTVNGGCARVSVTDRGRGIPKEFHARIFQRFSQADSSDSRPKGGTGLGLAISRALVEQMAGTIGYQTEAAGTTFFFELPAVSN